MAGRGLLAALGAALALGATSSFAVAAVISSQDSPGFLLKQALDHLYGDTYLQIVRLTTHSSRGGNKDLLAQVVREVSGKQSAVLIRLLEPSEVRGASMLIKRDAAGARDAYLYLPSISAVRRIASRQQEDLLFGTDLSYTDIDGWFALSARVKSVGIASGCVIIESEVDAEGSAYKRVVGCVEPERNVFEWLEFYSEKSLVKRLDVDGDHTWMVGDRIVPTAMRLQNEERGTFTAIEVVFLARIASVPARVLSVANLEKGSAIRDRVLIEPSATDLFGQTPSGWN